ncbi:MAG: hypothetical protein LBR83_02820 [Clostridiales bacterium]|jgi:uncharacterized protein with FMN-binding domain|nr:hypothetical protein [Clostridiales bacterium]
MGGTKIFVLQMKDLIRTAVFAVLGLILIVLLVVLFIPKSDGAQAESSLYIPGVYTSSIILNGEPVEVRVTVSDTEITAVEMANLGEVQEVFYPLFTPTMNDLASEVLQYQSADIVPVTDYPVTADILRQAVSSALQLAAATGE